MDAEERDPDLHRCMTEILTMQMMYGHVRIWITGRTVGELTLAELEERCMDWSDADGCWNCPILNLCTSIPYGDLRILCEELRFLEVWEKCKDIPFRTLCEQVSSARLRQGDCLLDPKGHCTGQRCWWCLYHSPSLDSDCWRHTEDEFDADGDDDEYDGWDDEDEF